NVGYRDQFLAQPDARLNFDLKIFNTVALTPRKPRDLVVSVFEILLESFRKTRRRLTNLVGRDAKFRLGPMIKFFSIAANSIVAVLLDLRQHLPHSALERGRVSAVSWRGLL